jgi:hypothetical protein
MVVEALVSDGSMWKLLFGGFVLIGLWVFGEGCISAFAGLIDVPTREGRVVIELAKTPREFWYAVVWHTVVGVGLFGFGLYGLWALKSKK